VSFATLTSEASRPLDEGYLVLAEQPGNAGRESVDHAVLARHQGAEIELNLAHLDAMLAELGPGLDKEFAAIEQGLAGDAADIETGPAQRGTPIDTGDLQSELGRPDGRDVPARPGSDYHHVVLLGHHSAFGYRPSAIGQNTTHGAVFRADSRLP